MADLKFVSKVNTPDDTSYNIKDAYKSGVYPVIGTQTASTNVWTGALHGVNALYDGLTIMYYLPWAGTSTAATLNLTLDNGTSTGAVNCYYSTSRLTTHYGKGCNIIMTYHPAGSIKIDGTATTDNRWIANANYDSNNDTKTRQSLLETDTNRPLLMSYALNNNTTTNVDNVTYRNNDIYANPSDGTITANGFNGDLNGDASTVNGHTVEADVPSNAKFTDHTYSGTGLISVNSSGVISTTATDNTGTITGVETTAGAHTAINVTSGVASFNIPTTAAHVGAAASSHSHGNIANGGTISSTAVTPKSTDYLLISDTSNSGKIERGVAIGTGTTKFLREDGTWQTPAYPTVNNAALKIQLGGTDKKSFTANASTAVTANFVFTAGTTPSTVTKKTVVTDATFNTVVTSATVTGEKLTISTGVSGSKTTGDSVTITAGIAPSLVIN